MQYQKSFSDRNTVTKYLEENYDSLCLRKIYSKMKQFYNYINKMHYLPPTGWNNNPIEIVKNY